MTAQYRFFLCLAGIFLLINLFIANGFTSLWDGAEAFLAWQGLDGVAASSPQELVLGLILKDGGIPHFQMRLPGALVFILAMAAYWVVARKLFGGEAVLSTLLFLGASLLVPNIAKIAAGDIWAMASQWLAFIVLIRFLKQPSLQWRLAFYGLLALAIWIQPANALIFLMGSSAFLYFLHPQGKRLWRLNPWLAGLALFLLLYYSGLATFSQEGFLVGFRSGRFLLWNLAGILPFLGFVLAGLWETLQRLGRREEMALINAAGLLFSLLGHSLALPGILAFLVAKQLKNYFSPNYPYTSVVKTGALLHLTAAFCLLTFLMAGSFFQFQAIGFRATLAAGGIYWMLSFIAVIGLFGPNRRYLLGSLPLSGLLLTTLFWLQLNPLLESRRGWPKALARQSREITGPAGSDAACLISRQGEAFPALAPYAKAAFPETALLNDPAHLPQAWADEKGGVFLLERSDADKLEPSSRPALSIKGWDKHLKAAEYVLLIRE